MSAPDLSRERFPRSSAYDADWVLAGGFGSHPLWMLEWLCEVLPLEPGMRVLDLGCGRAKSSIFLAREFGVEVWAADLWVDPTENAARIEAAELAARVFPLHVEARDLPFAEEFFDAAVCVDSYQYFGTDALYLDHLVRFVRPGGRLAVVSSALERDFEDGVPEHLEDFWTQDCWALHTAEWWRALWQRTGLVEVEEAASMPDGWRVWLDWARLNGFEEWTEALERDAGRYLGYARVVGRRRGDVRPWDAPRRGADV